MLLASIETDRLTIKRKLGIEGQAELIEFAAQHAQFGGPEHHPSTAACTIAGLPRDR